MKVWMSCWCATEWVKPGTWTKETWHLPLKLCLPSDRHPNLHDSTDVASGKQYFILCWLRHHPTGGATALGERLYCCTACGFTMVSAVDSSVSAAERAVGVVMRTWGRSTSKNWRCLATCSSVFPGVHVDLHKVITRNVESLFLCRQQNEMCLMSRRVYVLFDKMKLLLCVKRMNISPWVTLWGLWRGYYFDTMWGRL